MPAFTPIVQVLLGVARDMSAERHSLTFPLFTLTEIAGAVRERLNVRHLAYDPAQAPEGKPRLIVTLDTTFDAWERLSRDRPAYQTEKQRTIDAVIAALDERYPRLAQQVEVADIATPMT
jgi:phytoene dehydrogenase-like protein